MKNSKISAVFVCLFMLGIAMPVQGSSIDNELYFHMRMLLKEHPEIGNGIVKIANLQYSPLVYLGVFSALNYSLACALPQENSIAGHCFMPDKPNNRFAIHTGKALSLLSGASLLASYAGFSKLTNERLMAASVISNIAASIWNFGSFASINRGKIRWLETKDCKDILIQKVKENNVESVEELIRFGVPVGFRIESNDEKIAPIFHAACLQDGAAMVKLLNNAYELRPREDRDAWKHEDDYFVSFDYCEHLSPLCMAVSVATAEALIDSGADLHHKDKQGRTPLHLVQSVDLATLFLDKGAHIDVKDSSGTTPLHAAICDERYDIAKLLIERGADISLAIKGGGYFWTAAALIRHCISDPDRKAMLLDAIAGRATTAAAV